LADFHLMSVRQVFPGSTSAGPTTEFVEMQMYAASQTNLSGHITTLYNSFGVQTNSCVFSGSVPNGDNQRSVLVGTPGVVGAFGVTPDCLLSNVDALSLTGGAACWGYIDCISWGNFTPTYPYGIPSPSGANASPSGITDGKSLTRSIAAGCPTLLEASDDTNSSLADFSETAPTPRNNATSPTETLCSGQGGNGAPNTKIKKRPKNRSTDTSPTWKFRSTEPGSAFKCKLDHKKFRKCKSPKTYHGVDPAKHVFKVEAIDSDGNRDKTPAKDKFKILP
jgi:hypothetical protein